MVEVTFRYDETCAKWDVIVSNTESADMAKHAFTAVVLTCATLCPDLQRFAQVSRVDSGWRIIPAISAGTPPPPESQKAPTAMHFDRKEVRGPLRHP